LMHTHTIVPSLNTQISRRSRSNDIFKIVTFLLQKKYTMIMINDLCHNSPSKSQVFLGLHNTSIISVSRCLKITVKEMAFNYLKCIFSKHLLAEKYYTFK
jgi:hypothetical protein